MSSQTNPSIACAGARSLPPSAPSQRAAPLRSARTRAARRAFDVIVFTHPDRVEDELSLVPRVLEAGVSRLHVRKPSWSRAALRQYVVDAVPEEHRRRIVLHTAHDLASELGLGGVHYREAERPALPLPALDGLTQSTGFHDMAPLRAADQGGLTYAFLSPVFDSVSKVGYKSARFDEQELRSTLAACPRPVYALGGVTPDRVPQLADLGFAGAAVIGHVWGSDDPVGSLRALLDAAERV